MTGHMLQKRFSAAAAAVAAMLSFAALSDPIPWNVAALTGALVTAEVS